jgi:hemerythrin-like domain-containing protein
LKRDPALIGLSHDHHHALSRARKLRRAATAGSATALAEAHAFLAFFEGETARHFEQEEQYVFPLLGSVHPDVQRALGDHRTIRTLVAALAADTESGAVQPEQMAEVASALEVHIRFEERELFEEIQRRTDRSVLEAVSRQLEAADRAGPEGGLPDDTAQRSPRVPGRRAPPSPKKARG